MRTTIIHVNASAKHIRIELHHRCDTNNVVDGTQKNSQPAEQVESEADVDSMSDGETNKKPKVTFLALLFPQLILFLFFFKAEKQPSNAAAATTPEAPIELIALGATVFGVAPATTPEVAAAQTRRKMMFESTDFQLAVLNASQQVKLTPSKKRNV
jgi:hypothetical protein